MTKSMFGGMPSFNVKSGADSFFSRVRNNMSWGTIGIILAVIAFLIVSIYYYNKVIAPKMNPSYKANSENIPVGSQGGKQAELLLFSVDWCPHCKTAKPEWESLKQEYQGKTINGYVVIFTDVNCTNESPEVEKLMNTYKVEGYPTIKLLKDGQVIEYDAKPTKATLTQFLNSVL
uniref:Thioredoxin domain-containing protein n=1 Tax=viral metagenome TaxID=1070528 RepID=A0A6C0DTE2_9ZZZZ